MPQFLTIIGNVASGKTTAMPILANALNAQMIAADDLFQTSNPFREQYLNDIQRWSFTNELWMTKARASLMDEHAKLGKTDQLTLVDSGLLMSFVYSHSHVLTGKWTSAEWGLYEELFDHFATDFIQQTQVVYLEYSLDTLMKRLQKRAREYELQYYTKAYLAQIERSLTQLVQKLEKQGIKVVRVRESDVADFERNEEDRARLVGTVEQFIVKQ